MAVGCNILTITKLEKKVFNWSRSIPLGCHAGVFFNKVLGGDYSVFIPEVFEDLGRSVKTNFCDYIFESGKIFFRVVICNYPDEDDLKFTEVSVFFTKDVVSADAFGDLGNSDSSCIRWVLS